MKRTMSQYRRRLAVLWFIGAGLWFLLLVAESAMGRFADRTTDAWGWFLPTLMPTLSLIIGVLVIDTVRGKVKERAADGFLFRLTFGISAVYLIAVGAVLLLHPLSQLGPIELMSQSNLWLGPLQGLVAAALGAFFVKTPIESDATDSRPAAG